MDLFKRSTTPTHPADWSLAPRATKLLALAMILLTLLGIVSMHLAARAYELQGPSRIARNAAGITLVNAYEKLYLVDAQQHLIKRTAADLGLVGPINSIRARDAGWLLGDDDTGLLYRCDEPLTRCQPLFPNRIERLFSRAHGIAELDGRLIISDSERHRLRVFDSTGHEVQSSRTEPLALCYPNDVIVVDGMLYVTDTNNFRIARVDPDSFKSETFIQTASGGAIEHSNCADLSSKVAERGDAYANLMLDTVNTVGRPTLQMARHGRILPASILHPRSGDWWVVQMKGMMSFGDVILYSPQGTARMRVALPEDSEPTNLLETDDGVLVTDPTLARIYTVDFDGKVRTDWGPTELKAEWQQILTSRARWARLEPLGWWLIGAGIALGMVVVVREVMRTKGNWNPKLQTLAPVATQARPLDAPEVWIAVEPAYAQQVKRAAWLGIALIAAFFIAEGLVIAPQLDNSKTQVLFRGMGVLVLAVGIGLALVFRRQYQQQHMRIGTDGMDVLFDAGNGRIVRGNINEVLASGISLLIGKHLVNVRTPRGKAVFPPEQLAALILARIAPANFVGRMQLFKAALQRGNLGMWAAVTLICFYLVLLAMRHW